MAKEDGILVMQARQGSQEAFRLLLERHLAPLLTLCRSFLGDPVESEDVTQEAFMAAYGKLADLRKPERFPAWLYQIARNLCRDRLARRTATPQVRPLSAIAGSCPAPDGGRDDQAPILAALEALPAEYGQVLRLRHLEGCSLGEIARLTGLTANGVNTRLYRARQALRRQLEEEA